MLFIFDWDGTLSDSTGKIIGCMQKAAKDVGLEVKDDEAIKNIIGLGLPEALETLYPGISPEHADALRSNYSQHFVIDDQVPSLFFPGVMEALETLRDNGHALTVATGKSRRGLDRVWGNLGLHDFFHGSRCADETASKPHPQMLEELCLEFGQAPKDAVMVGDTEWDMAMAQALDMPRIAVSYGAHHVSRLEPYNPVLCMDDFLQILSFKAALTDPT